MLKVSKPTARCISFCAPAVDTEILRQETMTALCRRVGLSRKTGYKWLARYRLEGIDGLIERSRAPHTHARLVTAAVAERCLAVRRAHRSWGPVKVRAWLERDEPEVAWPAASTIGELFDREGLTIKRRLRRRAPPSSAPFAGVAMPMRCGVSTLK